MPTLGTDPLDPPIMNRGDACPDCKGRRKGEHPAVIPMLNPQGEVIHPHCYVVCAPCHHRQQLKKYGEAAVAENDRIYAEMVGKAPRKQKVDDSPPVIIQRLCSACQTVLIDIPGVPHRCYLP